jgi:3-oxoisoapionate decarboxylase
MERQERPLLNLVARAKTPVSQTGVLIMTALNRRDFLYSTVVAPFALLATPPRRWPLGINTYCLRFWRMNDRQLFDWVIQHKLDAIFLQDSLDPGVMDPSHWNEIRSWARDAKLRIETGGSALLPKTRDGIPDSIALLRKNIARARAMGAPMVRTLIASDRYSMPEGPVEQHLETIVQILRSVRSEAMDANLKIGVENHKDVQAWRTRQVIETAGKEFVGSYLDTGNPVFVAEDPMTTVEELGPYAVTFHLRDSVIYEHPEGIAVQWVPLGEGTIDFKALVARASDLIPKEVFVYCKPITARPPVVLPVYSEEFWTRWFPNARSRDFARFLALARRGRPWNKPHLMADVAEMRDRHMESLKIQQMAHMEQSLEYCRKDLDLGVRWRE